MIEKREIAEFSSNAPLNVRKVTERISETPQPEAYNIRTTEDQVAVSIVDLSPELLLHIFSWLNETDMYQSVSRVFRKLSLLAIYL